MHKAISQQLIALAADDIGTRDRLAANDPFTDSYHLEMQAAHVADARHLEASITPWAADP